MRARFCALLSPLISTGISRMMPQGAAGRFCHTTSNGSLSNATSSQWVAESVKLAVDHQQRFEGNTCAGGNLFLQIIPQAARYAGDEFQNHYDRLRRRPEPERPSTNNNARSRSTNASPAEPLKPVNQDSLLSCGVAVLALMSIGARNDHAIQPLRNQEITQGGKRSWVAHRHLHALTERRFVECAQFT